MAGYRLTVEGQEYLKNGLPEKNLVELLNKYPRKSLPISKAIASVKGFSIALKWGMERDWVSRREDEIFLLRYPGKIPEQEALEKIAKGRQIDEKILEILVQRKLVEKVVVGEVDKLIGKEVTTLTPELLKTGLWKKVKLTPYNVNVPIKEIYPAKIHPYRQVVEEVRERLIGLGFVEARGPLVELNFWNADTLFMPSDHPARGIHDVFIVKGPKFGKVADKELWGRVEATHKGGWITGSKGWGNWDFELARQLVLRSQTTAVSARVLSKLKKENLPHKMFVIGRNFRPDVIDVRHSADFDMCEGVVVGEGLTLKHLLGYLKEIAVAVTGSEKVMFRPHYFPFTEPSVEGYAHHPKLGWIEFGGAGIFRPEVTLPLGVEVPVLAWGLGIGRLAMIKMGVDDMRYLQTDDINWLRKKSLVV